MKMLYLDEFCNRCSYTTSDKEVYNYNLNKEFWNYLHDSQDYKLVNTELRKKQNSYKFLEELPVKPRKEIKSLFQLEMTIDNTVKYLHFRRLELSDILDNIKLHKYVQEEIQSLINKLFIYERLLRNLTENQKIELLDFNNKITTPYNAIDTFNLDMFSKNYIFANQIDRDIEDIIEVFRKIKLKSFKKNYPDYKGEEYSLTEKNKINNEIITSFRSNGVRLQAAIYQEK